MFNFKGEIEKITERELSEAQKRKLTDILSDEKKMKAILESDAAKKLFKSLGGGKKDV